MFTKKVFELQAKMLGSHVIPLCVSPDLNAGGAMKWDLNKCNNYHSMGNLLVVLFQENPNFDLDKFNDKVWKWFEHWVGNSGWDYLLDDKSGMTLAKDGRLNTWVFRTNHVLSY